MRTVVLYNSDAHFRSEFVRFKVNSGEVRVLDAEDKVIRHQINPVWASDQYQQKLEHVAETFQLVFIAPLPPLSISTFRIEAVHNPESKKTLIYCSECSSNSSTEAFQFYPLERLDIQVENEKMKLVFDGDTGFLKSIYKKSSGQVGSNTSFSCWSFIQVKSTNLNPIQSYQIGMMNRLIFEYLVQ